MLSPNYYFIFVWYDQNQLKKKHCFYFVKSKLIKLTTLCLFLPSDHVYFDIENVLRVKKVVWCLDKLRYVLFNNSKAQNN